MPGPQVWRRRLLPARFCAGIGALAAVALVLPLLAVTGLALLSPRHTATVVSSDSMAPAIRSGDVVVVRAVEADTALPPWSVILHRPVGSERLRLHRVLAVDDGGYLTKGDANLVHDGPAVPPERVLGAGVLVVPAVGTPLLWIDQGRWGVLLVLLLVATAVARCARRGWLDLRRPLRPLPAPPSVPAPSGCAACARLEALLGAPAPCYHQCPACERLAVLLGASAPCYHTEDDEADEAEEAGARPPAGRPRPPRRAPVLRPALAAVAAVAVLAAPAAAAFTARAAAADNHLATAQLPPPGALSAAETCRPPQALPAFRAAASGSVRIDGVTVARPPGTQPGDALIAAIIMNETTAGMPAPSAPAGWTLLRDDRSSNGKTAQTVFWKIAGDAEPASYTFGAGAATSTPGKAVLVQAYSGVDPVAPIGAHGGATSTETLSVTAPSITTTRGNATLVGFFGIGGARRTFTVQQMTKRIEAEVSGTGMRDTAIAGADEPHPGPGPTGTRTATPNRSGGHSSIGQLLALQPPVDADVALTWTPSPSELVTGYALERVGGPIRSIDGRATTSAQDGPVQAGVAVTWRLQAVMAGTQWRSTPAEVTLTPSC